MSEPRSVRFGPTERPLFGRLHAPESGQIRAAVLLCAPLGTEGFNAHRAYQQLALDLEALGFATLRFDYDGTGNSAGNLSDPGRVPAWEQSIDHALAYVRELGAARVALVGMRAGAILTAMAAERDESIDALVLWDPSANALTNVREQHALFLVVTEDPEGQDDRPAPAGGGTEMLGFSFDAETLQALRKVDLRTTKGPLADHVLVATRTDRVRDPDLVARLDLPHVEWREIDERHALLGLGDAVHEAHDRLAATAQIAGWLSGVIPTQASQFTTPMEGDAAIVTRDQLGRPIVERVVHLGPHGLFGIATEVEGELHGPTIVLFNSGVNYHIGPGRMWVELAREWAEWGLRTVRVDLSGIGESPVRLGQQQHLVYTPEALDDICDIAAAVSPDDPANVALMGICAGAYTAIEGAIRLSARAMCAVNPILTFAPPERDTGREDPGRLAVQPKRWWMRHPLAKSDFAKRMKPKIPVTLWRVADAVGLQASPARSFETLIEHGVDTLIVCDQRDSRPFLERGSWILRRLTLTGSFRFEGINGFDHLLYTSWAREQVRGILDRFLRERFADRRTVPRLPPPPEIFGDRHFKAQR